MGEHVGRHRQGCVLRDDHHYEPCLTALPLWWDPDCEACDRLYGDPRYSCEDICIAECVGACGVDVIGRNRTRPEEDS